MKEKIYSIPLSDALRENCGCILCNLHKKLDLCAVEYFLGPSLMEPDGRELTNEKGFCEKHINALFESGNRLGLALMLETHIDTLIKKLVPKTKKTFFNEEYDLSLLKDEIKKTAESCTICDKVASQMHDAAENLVYLWDKEEDFRKTFEGSYGLCLSHMVLVLSVCKDELNSKKTKEFVDVILSMQKGKMEKHYEKLHEFTLSFDYRNSGKPLSDEAKNSVAEAIKRLTTTE